MADKKKARTKEESREVERAENGKKGKPKEKGRVVMEDIFEYDSKADRIYWYGILEDGTKWQISHLDPSIAEDWVYQIRRCLGLRRKDQAMKTEIQQRIEWVKIKCRGKDTSNAAEFRDAGGVQKSYYRHDREDDDKDLDLGKFSSLMCGTPALEAELERAKGRERNE